MQKFELFFFPMTCARVAMVALEAVGVDYQATIVDLFKGEQREPAYRAIHPGGKVPALRIGDKLLTESAAILLHLDALFPEARLLPSSDPWLRTQAISDLVWCTATVHPAARLLRVPMHYTVGDQDPVREKGREVVPPLLARMEQAVSASGWWRGGDWSVIDPYVGWLFGNIASTAFDMSAYPGLCAHAERVAAHPAYERMYQREGEAMAAVGLSFPPGVSRHRP